MQTPALQDAPLDDERYADVRTRTVSGGRDLVLRYAVVGGISLAGSTYLIRNLGPSGWASYGVAYFLLAFFDQHVGVRVLGVVVRRVNEWSSELLGTAAWLMYALGAAFLLILALAAPLVSATTALPDISVCLLAAGACACVYSWRGTALAILEARMNYRIVAASEIVDQLVFYVVAIPLVASGQGIPGVALALALRGLPSALILRRAARPPRLTTRPTRSDLRDLAAYAVPSLGIAGWLLLEGLIPLAMLGGSHVDVLAFLMTSSSLLGYATVVQVVAYRVGFPAISRLAEQRARLPAAIDRAMSATLAVQFACIVPLVGLSPAWMPLLFGSAWHDAPWVMLVMSAGFVCSGAIGVLSGSHYGLGNPRMVATAYAVMTTLYLVGAGAAVQISALVGVAAAYAASRAVGVALLLSSMRRSGIRVRAVGPALVMVTTVALTTGLVVGLRIGSVAVVVPVTLAYSVILALEVRAHRSLLTRALHASRD